MTNRRIYATAVLYALAITTLLVMLAGMVTLLNISDDAEAQRQHNIEISAQNRELLQLTVSCNVAPDQRKPPLRTAPPDDCFTQQQSRIGRILGEPPAPINPTVIAAAACGASNPGDFARTRACVVETLREQKVLQDERKQP